MEKMMGKNKLALAILAGKPKDEEDSDDDYSDEEMSDKEIAAEELQNAISTGTAMDVAEAFQSLVSLCV